MIIICEIAVLSYDIYQNRVKNSVNLKFYYCQSKVIINQKKTNNALMLCGNRMMIFLFL